MGFHRDPWDTTHLKVRCWGSEWLQHHGIFTAQQRYYRLGSSCQASVCQHSRSLDEASHGGSPVGKPWLFQYQNGHPWLGWSFGGYHNMETSSLSKMIRVERQWKFRSFPESWSQAHPSYWSFLNLFDANQWWRSSFLGHLPAVRLAQPLLFSLVGASVVEPWWHLAENCGCRGVLFPLASLIEGLAYVGIHWTTTGKTMLLGYTL